MRAASGTEAVELVQRETFAAILLDVQMPGLDGFETARLIKRLPNGREVPIIFVTAVYKEDDDARRGYAAGGLDFFPKPLDPDLLKAKVKIYADLFVMTHLFRKQDSLAAALRERQRAERKLETILKAISEGVVVADQHGHSVQANHEADRLFGGVDRLPFLNRGEYSGWLPESGDQVASHDWPLLRALDQGVASSSEVAEIEMPDGSKRLIMNSASPLRDESDAIVGAVCVFKEIPDAQWSGAWPPPTPPPDQRSSRSA